MQKQRLAFSHLLEQEKLILSIQKVIDLLRRFKQVRISGTIKIEIRLSPLKTLVTSVTTWSRGQVI